MTPWVRRSPAPLWAGAAAVLVVAAVGLHWMLPWLTREGGVRVSTPVPPARFSLSPLAVKPGHEACVVNATIPAGAQVASFAGSVPSGKPGPPLTASVEGPGGYRWQARVPARWPEGISFHFRSPPHDLVGSFCLRNAGRYPFVLNGNGEPGATGRASSTLDGKPAPAAAALQLLRIQPASRWSRLGEMLDRAVAFSWRPLTGGIARFLTALVLLLVPVGAIGALVWAMAADRRPGAR